ncbi:hypothetical protein EB796_021057 [Bugula neritina]|uniref:Uncharacterized protein n=1 Tax=Bugula neritina TaxID=10212 RepID=A0A7J7J358_BUGNE|nr:hypothetical protein EB796_021057 [Bugula neritina]
MVRYQRDRGLETSPNRQLLERTQANSWEQAADQAFPSQSSASLVDLDTLSNEGVLYERPLSAASASTQTDADDMVKLRKKLVMALSREDCLKEERKHLRDLHRQYEEALKASQKENEEIRSRLSEADADLDNQIQKRLETAEMANTLQRQLAKKDAELKQSNQTVSELKERLSRSKSDLSASQDELSSTRQELNSANQNLIDSSKKFKETAKQLREVKDHLHKVQEEHGKFLSELQQTTSSLKKKDEQKEMAQAEVYSIWDSFSKAEDELRASQTELRIAKEELARKTNGQVEQRKRLIQLESEREAVLRRRETLPFLAQELQAPPVVSADYGGRLHDTLMAGKQSPVPSLHNYVFAFTNGDNADAGLGLRAECELIELLKLNITQINELLLLKQELLAPGRFAVSRQAGVPIQPVHSQSLPLSVKHKLSTPSFQGWSVFCLWSVFCNVMLSAKCLLLSCAIVAHHSKQPISFSDQLNTSGNNATDQSLADYNTAGPMARNSYMVSHDVSTGQVSQGPLNWLLSTVSHTNKCPLLEYHLPVALNFL